MSRSSYRTESTTEDRDLESRRDRERERSRAADRFDDSETRHHGKWTASSETVDLEGSGAPRRSLSRRDSSTRDRSRSRSRSPKRGDYDRESRRSRNYDSNSGYGSIPTPPPMPPANFWQPQGSYRSQTHGGYHPSSYGAHTSSYGTHPSSYGSHPAYYGHPSYGYGDSYSAHSVGYGGYHPSAYNNYSTGYSHPQSSYNSHPSYASSFASGYNDYHSTYGQDSYSQTHPAASRGVHPIHQAFLAQQGRPHLDHQTYGNRSRSLSSGTGLASEFTGYHPAQQPQHFQTQGYHMARPHCDIYELGNEYIIELDLPGHTRDHVDIKLSGNELYVISKPPARTQDWHVNERWLGRHNVERKFYLPADVNGAAIAPVLANGVLRLALPRHATTTTAASVLPHGKTTTTNDTTTTTTTTTQAAQL